MATIMKPSESELRLGVLHYHLLPGGVATVIVNCLKALIAHGGYRHIHIDLISSDAGGEPGKHIADQLRRWADEHNASRCEINLIELAELGYNDAAAASRDQLRHQGQRLCDRLVQVTHLQHSALQNKYVLHAHNANLGKNPTVTLALALLAQRIERDNLPAGIVYQMHDFAEDNRPTCWQALRDCTGRGDPEFAAAMMYPDNRCVTWACINSADKERLLSVGIDPERVTVLPNAIDAQNFAAPALQEMSADQLAQLHIQPIDFAGDLKDRIGRFAAVEGFCFEAGRKILLAPVKAVRRKNITESVMLLLGLNRHEDNWQLLITLSANSPADVSYCQAIEQFVKQHRLPVVIGFGAELLARHERLIEGGRVCKYSLIDLMALAEAVVTTSIQEGFGYVFHEPWLAGKAVIGRNIRHLTCDFAKKGVCLDHLYDRALIRRAWLGGDWDRLREKYCQKINNIRQSLGYDKLPESQLLEAIERQKTYVPATPNHKKTDNAELADREGDWAMVDWADLDLRAQLKMLERLREQPDEHEGIVFADERLKVMSDLINQPRSQLIEDNGRAVRENYGLAAQAAALVKLLARIQQGADQASSASSRESVGRSNHTILTEAVRLENIHLLC